MLNKIDVLSEIAHSLQEQYDSMDDVVMHKDILNAIQVRHEDGFENGIDPGSLLFNENREELTRLPVLFVHNHPMRSPQEIKHRFQVANLKAIFEKCRIISFADWANFSGASDLWDRLRTEVIKPLD